jgi:phosphomevalonate kinase
MTLVAISGKRRSGKSFMGTMLEKHYGYRSISLAAPLKQMIREQFGLTEDQTDGHLKEIVDMRYGLTPRELMIRFGAFYRSIDRDFWVKKLFDQIKQTPQAQMGKYVITDMRFKNELDWFKRHGATLVRLERDEEFTGPSIDDPSEKELDDYAAWDVLITKEFNRDEEDMYTAACTVACRVV